MRKVSRRYDLLVTPGVSVPAFRARVKRDGIRRSSSSSTGRRSPTRSTLRSSLPASAPGFDDDGLPLATQIVGPDARRRVGAARRRRWSRRSRGRQWRLFPEPLPPCLTSSPSANPLGNERHSIPSQGSTRWSYGGDTMNFCIAAARQGASVGCITRVGNDPFGAQLRVLWEGRGH